MNNKTEITLTIATVCFLITVPAAIWIFGSSMESRAYNRLTGANSTTWDAMWTELRVTGTPNQNTK